MATMNIIGGIEKTIKYDRLTKDYSCFISIDGGTEEYIGSASTYGQAEAKCNEYAYDYFNDTCTPEAAAQLLDTRTPQEIAYDTLKDGSTYVVPVADEQPAAPEVDWLALGFAAGQQIAPALQAMQAERERQRAAYISPEQRAAVEFCAATAEPQSDEDDDENPLTPEEEAAYDAANQQKVYDRIKNAFASKSGAPMFVDTLPGRVNDTPIDLLVTIGIGAAMERNLSKLGLTRDQLFRILEVAVNPVVDEYLITPARRMRLIWDGME